ncbi:hypothetical protein HZS_7513 [Henneguya salminicola]|nr:hypothetical protein HZS_7513 [Henneguya salminicola]
MKVIIFGYLTYLYKGEKNSYELGMLSELPRKFVEIDLEDWAELYMGHTIVVLTKNNQICFSDLSKNFSHKDSLQNYDSNNCISFPIENSYGTIPVTSVSPEKFSFNHNVRVTFDDKIVLFNTSGLYIINPHDFDHDNIKKRYKKAVHDAWLCNDDLYIINGKKQLYHIELNGTEHPITYDGCLIENCVKLVGGCEHICVLTVDGSVYTYGSGTKGQIGCGYVDSFTNEAFLLDCFGIVRIKDIASGGWHILAQSGILLSFNLESNDLYGWGWNESYQLGGIEPSIVSKPELINITDDKNIETVDVIKISAGLRHSAIIDINGNVWAWGNNEHFQITELNVDKIMPICIYLSDLKKNYKTINCGRWNSYITY